MNWCTERLVRLRLDLHLFLTLAVLILFCFHGMAWAEPPKAYFGGIDSTELSDTCNADCVQLCPEDSRAYCITIPSEACFCHKDPENPSEANCKGPVNVPAGDASGRSTEKGNLKRCDILARIGYRTRVDVYACRNSRCFIKDYPEDLSSDEINFAFGGKTVLFDCNQPTVDACTPLCGNSFAGCVAPDFNYFPCLCHDPPQDSNGFTCSGPVSVAPGTSEATGSSDEDKCLNYAVKGAYPNNVDVYTCKNPDESPICVLADPQQPTTTTTEASTSLVGGNVSCKICTSDGTFLSLLVCSIVCTVFQVVGFVKSLLSKVVQLISDLFKFIPKVLDNLVEAIGNL